MRVFQLLIMTALSVFWIVGPVKAQSIRAGYDGLGQEEQLRTFRQYGINTHFRSLRIAAQLNLALDPQGRVVMATPPEEWTSLKNYCQKAEKLGIDIYFIAGFHNEHVEQLKRLGPYNKAVIQGPTRYHGPGEKPAPGPLEEKYWLGQLLYEAKYAAEFAKVCPNVKGLLIDVEMYAGEIMWRTHCSFDDQTYGAVMQILSKKRPDLDYSSVPKEDRYRWLLQNDLLEEYFSVEEQLVLGIARRFRRAIDAVNPDFQLGLLPYEANWFYDGWIEGLGSPKSPVLICSEDEYGLGLTPSSFAKIDRLKKKGLSFHYLPGLMPKYHSPKQFAFQAKRCLELTDGYWIFTTYSFWQPEPEKLWGDYLIQAPASQYWQLLAHVNESQVVSVSEKTSARYSCPGFKLLTNNRFYPGPKVDLPVKASYSVMPNVVLYRDPEKSKLFDGADYNAFGTAAWHAIKGEEISTVIDLSRPAEIQAIQLRAGHTLAALPSVLSGVVATSISLDGNMYYPVGSETVPKSGIDKSRPFRYDDLGVRARFVKISMKAEEVSPHSVWSFSEIAIWGQ